MIGEKQISCEEATRIRLGQQSGENVAGFDSVRLMALQSHCQSCDACRMDNALQRLMKKSIDGSPDLLRRKRRIGDAIAAARQSEAAVSATDDKRRPDANQPVPLHFSAPIFGWRNVVFAATLLTGIALGGLLFGGWGQKLNPHSQSVTKQDGRKLEHKKGIPQKVLNSGATDSHPNPVDTTADFNDVSHIALASGVVVLLDSDTKMMVQQSEDALLRVSIDRGKMLMSVDPSVPHPAVEVVTAEGVVAVKGTIFSVSATPKVEVSVLRGVVEAIHHSGLTRVAAGHSLSLNTGKLRSLQTIELDSLVRAVNLLRTDSDAAADGRDELAVSTDENPAAALPLIGGGDKNNVGAPAVLKPGIKKEINRLVSDARAKKYKGDWRGALEKYEAVIALSPRSSAAATSHIAAGNILLRLGDATAALNHFSSYLSGPLSSLRQEASFGKIKAYRQMRDYDNELATSRKFVAQWPNSVHAESIKSKIFHLEILASVPANPKNQ